MSHAVEAMQLAGVLRRARRAIHDDRCTKGAQCPICVLDLDDAARASLRFEALDAAIGDQVARLFEAGQLLADAERELSDARDRCEALERDAGNAAAALSFRDGLIVRLAAVLSGTSIAGPAQLDQLGEAFARYARARGHNPDGMAAAEVIRQLAALHDAYQDPPLASWRPPLEADGHRTGCPKNTTPTAECWCPMFEAREALDAALKLDRGQKCAYCGVRADRHDLRHPFEAPGVEPAPVIASQLGVWDAIERARPYYTSGKIADAARHRRDDEAWAALRRIFEADPIRELAPEADDAPESWTEIGKRDTAGRRSVWARLHYTAEEIARAAERMNPGAVFATADNVTAIHLCAGREGKDVGPIVIRPDNPQFREILDIVTTAMFAAET